MGLNLRIMTCPLAQKQARHTLLETATTSARSTNDDSVMLCTYKQACEGMRKTLAWRSEHTMARWPSPLASCEDDGEKLTNFLLRGRSESSEPCGSLHTSCALWIKAPVQSRKPKCRTEPFSIRTVPEEEGKNERIREAESKERKKL